MLGCPWMNLSLLCTMLDFRSFLYSTGLSSSTVRMYMMYVGDFRQFLASHAYSMETITSAHLSEFLCEFGFKSSSSRRLALAAVRALYRFIMPSRLASLKFVVHSDMRSVRYIPVDHVREMCVSAGSLWMRNFIAVAFLSGLRCSEICALRRCDVNISESLIYVCSSKSRKGRYIRLNSRAVSFIASCLSSRSLSPYDSEGTSRVINDYMKKFDKSYHIHQLRHSFAFYYIRAGHSIFQLSLILGHSSFASTSFYINSFVL